MNDKIKFVLYIFKSKKFRNIILGDEFVGYDILFPVSKKILKVYLKVYQSYYL